MKKTLLIGLALMLCPILVAQGIEGTILKKGKPKKGVVVWLKMADVIDVTDKDGHFSFTSASTIDTLQITASSKLDAKVAVGENAHITVELGDKEFTVDNGTTEQHLAYTHVSGSSGGGGVTHEVIMRSGLRGANGVIIISTIKGVKAAME